MTEPRGLDRGGLAQRRSPLRVALYAAKGGQGCTTTAFALAVLLSRHLPVDLTAHDPDEAAVLAGRRLAFDDEHMQLAPRVRLVVNPRKADASIVVHDAGTSYDLTDAPLPAPGDLTYLVTRPCFLALRRAVDQPIQPTGIVVIHEPERAIGPDDIGTILNRPVVATIPAAAAIARAVDAALLADHPPAILERSLRTLTESLAGPVPIAHRSIAGIERSL